MKPRNLSFILVGVASSIALFFTLPTSRANDQVVPMADSCCRVTVTGCGQKANVCVKGECNLDNQAKARKAFESANKCTSTNASSYIGTCSGEKCDLDLR